LALFVAGLAGSYWLYRIVPRAFVPTEDQGYGLIVVQAPEGASLEYTKKVGEQVQQVLLKTPEVDTVFAITGFSFAGSAPNRGLMFFGLKPYKERRGDAHSADAVIGRLRGAFGGITEAMVIPFVPPAVPGLGAFGGF